MGNIFKNKYLPAFFLLLILFYPAKSQLNFEHFTTGDGLSNNSIRRIIQDNKGFLWFGTLNGLNRYDGKQIRTYTFEPGNLNSLSSNRVYSLHEDGLNYLWIITFENHLLRFNPATEKFKNINHLLSDDLKKYTGPVSIYESSPGVIWIISDNEYIIRIKEDKTTGDISLEVLDLNDIVQNNIATNAYKDSRGNMWICSQKGLLKLNNDTIAFNTENIHMVSPDGQSPGFNKILELNNKLLFSTPENGIYQYNHDQGKLTVWRGDLEITSPVNEMFKGKNGDILITTRGQGFYHIPANARHFRHFSRTTTQSPALEDQYFEVYQDNKGIYWLISPARGITRYNPRNANIEYFGLNADFRESPGDQDKQTLLEDSNGNLWIGLYGGGLCKYNREHNRFEQFYYTKSNPYSLSSNFVLSLFEDASKNLWIGTFQGGLNKLELTHHEFDYIEPVSNARFKSENEVRSLLEDSLGRVWAGTKEGHIYCFDKHYNLIFKFPEDISGYKAYNKSNVYALIGDKKGNLWIGTKGEGLICIKDILSTPTRNLKSKNYKISHYVSNPDNPASIPYNDIFALHFDQYGQLWIGTYNGGIAVIENPGEKIEFKTYRHQPGDSTSLSDDRVRCFYRDHENNLWIGTSYGLNILKSEYLKSESKRFVSYLNNPSIKSSLSNNDILYIHQDKNHNIWAATYGGGLNLLRAGADGKINFDHFLRKDGLPSDVIFSILEDNKSNLWLGTENGLCKFLNMGQNIERFVAKDGTGDNSFSEGTCEILANGSFIFGLKSGMVCFHPDSIKREAKKYPMVITGFNIFDQRVIPGEKNSPLDKSIEFTREINLKHNQNFLSIEFALLDFRSPEKIQYAFILENFEEKWNYVINQNKATYRGLSPGKYIFKVKSTNNKNLDESPVELRINIAPPIWKTRAAYGLYIIFLIVFTWGIIYFVTKEVRIKNEINYEKRLTEDKLMFYTNISHEFKTPLTLITSSTEDLLESKTLSDENKKKVDLIKKNSSRLYNLIEQLLDFRRIQKGKMELKTRKTEIISFVNDLYLTFLPLAEKKKINFHFNTNIKEYLGWIDPKHLEKIVINLLSNAFKHTPEKKRILLDVEINTNIEKLTIKVVDYGEGIKKENLNKIFDRFAFIDKDIYDQFKGSGIGLSLSRDLVLLHKGEIYVTSEVNTGSTFTIEIPVGYNSYGENERDEKNQYTNHQVLPFHIDIEEDENVDISELHLSKTSSATKSQVLIVEDNTELRNYLFEKLKKMFNISMANDGEEGLNMANDIIPDLIISDVKMPKMDGLELTKALRNNFNTSHIPVILLTAKSAIEHRLEGLDYGADDYITKPFNMGYLQKRIMNIISQRKILKEKFSQDPGFKPEKLTVSTNDQKFLTEVIRLVEENLKTTNFSIENIIEEMGFSRTVFYKKMKAISGYAPKEFIRIVKMKKAAALLREPDSTITQVSYDIGYNDPDYFSKSFKNYFGEPPSEYQKKYR